MNNPFIPQPDLKSAIAFVFIFWSLFIGWTMYNFGYTEARADYATPTKYRCHEGVVYRSVEGMWQKSGTECKKLDEIK